MSLSDNSQAPGGNKTPAGGFKAEGFNQQPADASSNQGGFVALQLADEQSSQFLPFIEGAEGRHAQNKAAMGNPGSFIRGDQEREAYEEGFAQGEKDGLELGEQKAKKLVENIARMLDEINRLKHDILKQHEKEILTVVFNIARKVVHNQIRVDEAVVRTTILEALNLASARQTLVLRINPEDFDLVERLKPDFFASFKDIKSLTINADPAVNRGGCLLESSRGEIDADIETQLEKIYESLEAAFEEQ